MRANPPRASRPPCALNDTDAVTVINKMWACPAFNVTVVSTWIARLVISTSTPTTTVVFIQRAPKPQDQKKRKRTRQKGPRAKRGAAAAEPHASSSEDEEDLPPLHVFFDIEAMQPQEKHLANLVVAETEDNDEPKPFPGPTCIRDFLEWLDTLTLHDTRQVNVIAHNFQGVRRVLHHPRILWGQPPRPTTPQRM